MFRPIARSARSAARSIAFSRSVVSIRPVKCTSFAVARQAAPTTYFSAIRCYSAAPGLSKDEIQGRILDLLKNFDKVKDASKLSSTSNFANDLGLDSLDSVEVVMAIEEEFSIEIPDKEADAIQSVDKAVEYILAQPDAH